MSQNTHKHRWKTYAMVGAVSLVGVVGTAFAISPSKLEVLQREQEILSLKNDALRIERQAIDMEIDLNSQKWKVLDQEIDFTLETEQ